MKKNEKSQNGQRKEIIKMREILAVIGIIITSFFLGVATAWLIDTIKELKKIKQKLKELQNDKSRIMVNKPRKKRGSRNY